MGTQTLLDKIFSTEIKPKKSTDELIREALQRALDNITSERPGCPWDKEQEGEPGERTGE